MTVTLTLTTPVTPREFLQETGLRRAIPAELAEIRKAINRFNGSDSLSLLIRQWEQTFTRALQSSFMEKEVLQQFIEHLKKILVDDLTDTPLDDSPLLGSDGKTYGKKQLCVFLNTLSESERGKLHLWKERDHDLAAHMIGWLKRHGAYVEPAAVTHEFAKLNPAQIQDIIPTREVVARRERLARIRSLQQKREAAENLFAKRLLEETEKVRKEAERIFAHERRQQEQAFAQAHQKLDALDKEAKAAFDEVQRRIARSQEEAKENKKKIEELKRELEHLTAETQEAEREIVQIQLQLAELNEAIRKAEEERRMSLITGIVCIAASCVLTFWVLPALLPSSSAAMVTGDKVMIIIRP